MAKAEGTAFVFCATFANGSFQYGMVVAPSEAAARARINDASFCVTRIDIQPRTQNDVQVAEMYDGLLFFNAAPSCN